MSAIARSLLFLLSFLALSEPVPEYSDELTRNVLWPIQVLTYGKVDDLELGECFRKKFGGWVYIGGAGAPCKPNADEFSNQTCQYIIARSAQHQAILISLAILPAKSPFKLFQSRLFFRNGSNIIDKAILSENSTVVDDIDYYPGRVKEVAHNVAKRIFFNDRNFLPLFIKAFNSQESVNYAVWFTGHGTGAVVADVFSYWYATANSMENPFYLTVFGSPRPGDATYATARETTLAMSHHITQPNDRLISRPVGFFTHHLTEIFYPEGTAKAIYKVCSGREDPGCSAGQKGDS